MLHVLPKGLLRIRHYEFLANASRPKQLPRIPQAIAEADAPLQTGGAEEQLPTLAAIPSETWRFTCPTCHQPMRSWRRYHPMGRRLMMRCLTINTMANQQLCC